MWDTFDPQKLATLSTLDANRELVFAFYNERRTTLTQFQPNLGHQVLAKLQQQWGDRVVIYTQNGDDLLERAGAKEIIHLHGKQTDFLCRTCNHIWDVGYKAVDPTTCCPSCGSNRTKPGVIFFEEQAPLYAQFDWDIKTAQGAMIVVIGTQGAVLPFKRLVGNRHHPKRPIAILNNLHREDGIPYRKFFDFTYFAPLTEAIVSIEARVQSFLSMGT
jgi:NAD-dependent deacetylase